MNKLLVLTIALVMVFANTACAKITSMTSALEKINEADAYAQETVPFEVKIVPVISLPYSTHDWQETIAKNEVQDCVYFGSHFSVPRVGLKEEQKKKNL